MDSTEGVVPMKVRLTSLLLVEERLLEADYFARRVGRHRGDEGVGYELNAFLSAARSVTFLLQKEMSRVPGFSTWWDVQRTAMAADSAATFFLRLRNFSQKEGRVSIVGTSRRAGPRSRWTYRFAGNEDPVPAVLLHRDIVECCREHVAKLARIVLDCTGRFPFHSCPTRALTREGLDVLGLSTGDIEEALGLPRGWTEVGQPIEADVQERCDLLRRHVDGLDFSAIRRLASWRPRAKLARQTPSARLCDDLAIAIVTQLEARKRATRLETAASLLLDRLNEEPGT